MWKTTTQTKFDRVSQRLGTLCPLLGQLLSASHAAAVAAGAAGSPLDEFIDSLDHAAAALAPWLVIVPVANEVVDMATVAVRRAFCRYV